MNIKRAPKYTTRSVTYNRTKGTGTKVNKLEYLEKPALFDPYYSVPKKVRKPSKLAWRTPRGYIFVIGFGYLKEPPVIEVKFPAESVPFADLDNGEDKDLLLGF